MKLMNTIKEVKSLKKKTFLLIILAMLIGFAAVSTELIFFGTAKIGANLEDYDVFFSNVWVDGIEHYDFISDDGKSINFQTNILKNIGESTEIKYEITNASKQYDSTIKINCMDVNNSNDILYEESNDFNNFILARNKGNGKINITLIKSSIEDKDIEIKCTINTNAEEKSLNDDTYVASDYTSEEIEYKYSNNPEILNVKAALDDLYNTYYN